MGEWGGNGIDKATGSKKGAGGMFLIGVVNETVDTGRGRVVGPVDGTVSALATGVEEGEVMVNRTYQKYFICSLLMT
jgi:hypothetical protein